MYTPKACVDNLSNTNDVILPHEKNHGITLRCLKQVLMLAQQSQDVIQASFGEDLATGRLSQSSCYSP